MNGNQLYIIICSRSRYGVDGGTGSRITPIKYVLGVCEFVKSWREGVIKAFEDSETVKTLAKYVESDNAKLDAAISKLRNAAVSATDDVGKEQNFFYDIVNLHCSEKPEAKDVYFKCLYAAREFVGELYDYAYERIARDNGTVYAGSKNIVPYSVLVNGEMPFPEDGEADDDGGLLSDDEIEKKSTEGKSSIQDLDSFLQGFSSKFGETAEMTDEKSGEGKKKKSDDDDLIDLDEDDIFSVDGKKGKSSGSGDGSLNLDAMVSALSMEPHSQKEGDDAVDFSQIFNIGEEGESTAKQQKTATSGGKKKKKADSKLGTSGLAALINKVKKAQDLLLQDIFGQDAAVNTFISGYFNAEFNRITHTNTKQPRGVFLFAGPPGVGKTFLAEKSAEVLGLPFRRFDMSEYSDKESNFEFAGSDKVYKNGSEGNVTGFVAKNPNAIVLFDEIEKAHLNIIHLFLQILDAGRLRDNYTDEEVSFSDTIIIFTTNAGKQLYEDDTVGLLSSVPKKTIAKALATDVNPVTNSPMFPAAIISRLAANDIVMMDKMTAHNLERIARDRITSIAENFTKNTGVKIKVEDEVYSAIMFAEGGAADARTVKGKAKTFFVKELYELFRLADDSQVDVKLLNQIDFKVEMPESGAVRELFVNDEKPVVLVFAEDEVASAFASSKVEVYATSDPTYAAEILKTRAVSLVLVDITVGLLSYSEKIMNIEDMRGVGYDFMTYVISSFETPCYLIQNPIKRIGKDEMLTFRSDGIRGEIEIPENEKSFIKEVVVECEKLHRQKSMLALAKSNRVLSFDTRQIVSADGKKITVGLYDFRLSLALDTEDNAHVLTGVRKPTTTFDDIIGAEEAKGELRYFVEYLKNPEKFLGTGVKAPRGVLLYGPPGTGKTMLAKAMAGESDITFISAEGNEFLKRYVGEGPEAVHELFRSARKYAPAILFIDEIDAIGISRGQSEGNGATLTSFLTEMDGFRTDPKKPVFVLAATNYSLDENATKSLDSALLRRFDRRILIDLPNADDREKYLRLAVKRHPIIKIGDEEIKSISRRSVSMSLADIESVVELAMRECIKKNNDCVSDADFDDAFENFRSGDRKKWDEATVLRTARHEAGHTLISLLAGNCPAYLTIVSRGNFGGYMQKDDVDKFGYTREELLDEIRVCLGGRAAELVCYGTEKGITTGPSGDLRQATALAKSLLGIYGMDEEFGLAVMSEKDFNEKSVRDRINDILRAELEKAVTLIESNRDVLDRIVNELLLKNHLTREEIEILARK